MRVRGIDPPFLTDVRRQVQVDCDGFPFWGSRRRAEFVIGDDSLEMVWIFIEPAEYDAALRAMVEVYGEATARREGIIGFPDHRTGLRAQPSEVLFYSHRQAEEWREWYRQPSD
jgi:hypothetical protein